MRKLLVALLMVATASFSYGTVFFQNDGNKEGWPNFPQTPQAKGTINDVTTPSFQGNNAINFTQTWIPNYTGRYHSEVVFQNIQKTGDDRFYGLSVFFPQPWSTVDSKICIQQWAGDGPWILMELRGTELVFVRHAKGVTNITGPIPLGQWVRIVTHLRATKAGVLEVWVNGAKKFSLAGDFTVPSKSSQARWSAGEYVTGWTGVMTKPNPSFRQLFEDHYRVTSTEMEAEPANWNEP